MRTTTRIAAPVHGCGLAHAYGTPCADGRIRASALLRVGPAPRPRPGPRRTTRPRIGPVTETATRGRGHVDLRGMGAPARARTRRTAPAWRLDDPGRTRIPRPVRLYLGPATWRL